MSYIQRTYAREPQCPNLEFMLDKGINPFVRCFTF